MLRSTDPVVEPFIDILVELESSSGAKQREYTFLVEERVAQTARPAPGPRAPLGDPPAAQSPEARAPSRVRQAKGPAGADGYAVRAGDTLANIARSKQPAEVTLEQMMVALFQANEAAFVGSNMNRLSAGSVLMVPDADTARATNPTEARSIVRAHRAEFDAYRNRLASTVSDSRSTAPGSTTNSAGAIGAQQAAPPPPKTAPGDRLQLSRVDESKAGSAAGTAREDDTVAMQQALSDARERLATLERNLDDMRRLLALQSQQLAQVREFARTSEPPSRDAAAAEVPPRAPTAGGIPSLSAAPIHVPPREHSGVTRFARNYWPWFVIAFVLSFLAWIAMPVKTARLWRKQRRRRAREARRAAELAA